MGVESSQQHRHNQSDETAAPDPGDNARLAAMPAAALERDDQAEVERIDHCLDLDRRINSTGDPRGSAAWLRAQRLSRELRTARVIQRPLTRTCGRRVAAALPRGSRQDRDRLAWALVPGSVRVEERSVEVDA